MRVLITSATPQLPLLFHPKQIKKSDLLCDQFLQGLPKGLKRSAQSTRHPYFSKLQDGINKSDNKERIQLNALAVQARSAFDNMLTAFAKPEVDKERDKKFWEKASKKWHTVRGNHFTAFFRNKNIRDMFEQEAIKLMNIRFKNLSIHEQNLLRSLEKELNSYILLQLIGQKDHRNGIRRITIERYLNHFGLTHSVDFQNLKSFKIKVLPAQKEKQEPEFIYEQEYMSDPDDMSLTVFDQKFSRQQSDVNSAKKLTEEQKRILERDQVITGIREAMEIYPIEFVSHVIFGKKRTVSKERDLLKWNSVIKELTSEESAQILSALQDENGEQNLERLKGFICHVMEDEKEDLFVLSRMITILGLLPLSSEENQSINRITLDKIVEVLLNDEETREIGMILLCRSQYIATQLEQSKRFFVAYEKMEKPDSWYDLYEVLMKQQLYPGDLHGSGLIYEEESVESATISATMIIKEYHQKFPRGDYSEYIEYYRNAYHMKKIFGDLKYLKKNISKFPLELRDYVARELLELIEIQNIRLLHVPHAQYIEEYPEIRISVLEILKTLEGKVSTVIDIELREMLMQNAEFSRWTGQVIELKQSLSSEYFKEYAALVYINHLNQRLAHEALQIWLEMKMPVKNLDLRRFDLSRYDFSGLTVSGDQALQIIKNKGSLNNVTIQDADFSGQFITGIDFSETTFINPKFKNAELSWCEFKESHFLFDNEIPEGERIVDFSGANLHRTNFSDVIGFLHWDAFSFKNAVFGEYCTISETQCAKYNFDQADCRGLRFENVKFIDDENNITSFVGSDLRGVKLGDLLYQVLDLSKAKIQGLDLCVYAENAVGDYDYFFSQRGAEFVDFEKLFQSLEGQSLKIDPKQLKWIWQKGVIQDLSGVTFSGTFKNYYASYTFRGANFENANFAGTNISNTVFDNCNLKNTNFQYAEMKSVTIKSDLTETDLSQIKIKDCDFSNAKMSVENLRQLAKNRSVNNLRIGKEHFLLCVQHGIPLNNTLNNKFYLLNENISGADFSHKELAGITLSKVHFSSCNFYGASLKEMTCKNVRFDDCNFESAKFSNFDFVSLSALSEVRETRTKTHMSFSNCSLKKSDMSAFASSNMKPINNLNDIIIHFETDCDFTGAKLAGFVFLELATLSGTQNRLDRQQIEAYLECVKSHQTILKNYLGRSKDSKLFTRFNCKGMDLSGISFSEFDLSGTDFSDCNLCGVDFTYTDLYNVKFDNGKIDSETIFRNCKNASQSTLKYLQPLPGRSADFDIY